METGAGQTRRRRVASLALAVAGAAMLLIGGIVLYAGRALFDSEEFAQRATTALEDERVREPLAEAFVDALIENAEPDLVNARPVLVTAVEAVIDTGAFREVFRQAVERTHRTLFTRDRDNLVLNLADGTAIAINAVEAISPKVAEQIPRDIEPKLNEIVSSDFAIGAVKVAEDVRAAGVVLPLIGLLLLAGAVAVDRDRRRALLTVAIAIAAAAGTGLAALLVARALTLGQLDESVRDAGRAVWAAYLDTLRSWLMAALGVALVFAAAITTRRRVDAVEPLRRVAAVAGRQPSRPGWQAVRALLVLAVGLLIVISPDAFLNLLAVVVGAYAVFYALSELLVLIAPPAAPGEPRAASPRRLRPLPAIEVLAVVAAIVAVVVLWERDEDGARPRVAASIERCNGFAELCDRRVSEVAFPSVHNAMSAANDGFLLANNQRPIPDQLEAGVRGLLIDAHYGRRGGGDKVITDLQREGKTRGEVVEAVGADFVEAAERLIGRVSGTDAKGAPGTYLCHVFCELGAIPMTDELARIRKFLETHPDEVLVIFIEDYVTPKDIETAFTESRLVDYAYVQHRADPLPTLREMIASGRRLLVMAENVGGGEKIPWYLQGFEFTQETPFTFNSAAELEAAKSCETNRGEPDNPLFQLNHWVEKIPRSPKTAARVNSFDFLHDRAERCARERDLLSNLVAVDFWERGDLFDVANALNGVGRRAKPTYSQGG